MINQKKLFYLRCKGLNMQEIAKELEVSRVTIQRHFSKYKQMEEQEFKKVLEVAFF